MASQGLKHTHAARHMAVYEHNRRAWNAMVHDRQALTRPASDQDLIDPAGTVDPAGWLGGELAGRQVLCLAAGGGRQSVLYAAAGAQVTVVDLSSEMLALDRQVAEERGFTVQTVETSMDDLSALATATFDVVIHPVSTCYVPEVAPVFREVARVTAPGGLYISQHKSPVSLQAETRPQGQHYRVVEPYDRTAPLPVAEPSRLRESGTLEFVHTLEQLLGGICRAGFVIEDLLEPCHADPEAAHGTFGHRARFIAPYLRIKARRMGVFQSAEAQTAVWMP